MKNNIYAMKNKFSPRFTEIAMYDTDEAMSYNLNRAGNTVNPQTGKPLIDLSIIEIYQIALFDEETGELIKLEKPVKKDLKPITTDQELIQAHEKNLTNKKE